MPAMVFKAARRDVANHSFESTRRRLGDHKARRRLTILRNGKIAAGNRKEKEKKKKRKTRKRQM
jgi:hypothetical protein